MVFHDVPVSSSIAYKASRPTWKELAVMAAAVVSKSVGDGGAAGGTAVGVLIGAGGIARVNVG